MGGASDRTKPTEARFALAENVTYLMEAYRKGFQVGISTRELAKALHGLVSYKSVERMRDAYDQHSPSLDHIDLVAEFFEVETWQLLRRRPGSPASQEVEVTLPPKPSSHRK